VAYGITAKNRIWVASGVAGAIVVFSVLGLKTALFAPFYMVLLAILILRFRRSFGICWLLGIQSVILVCVAEAIIFDTNELSAYLSQRLFLVPGQLCAYYYDFFLDHGFTYYSNSLFKWLPGAVGQPSTGYVIGETYFGNIDSNANASVWACGYADMGFAGMLLTSVALGYILRVIDGLAKGKKFLIVCLVAGLMGVSWGESSLPSSLLSCGVLSSIVLLHVLKMPDARTTQQRWSGPEVGAERLRCEDRRE
jgi:hypothetical protein